EKFDILPDDWLTEQLTKINEINYSKEEYSDKNEFIDHFVRYEFDENHDDTFKSILGKNYSFTGERGDEKMSGQEIEKEELNLGRNMSAAYKLPYIFSLIDFDPELLLKKEENFSWLKYYYPELKDEHVKNLNESFKTDFFKIENDVFVNPDSMEWLKIELNKYIKVEFMDEQ
ncbi:11007_t:CDS:1, partial [Dentiscutata heterogama]